MKLIDLTHEFDDSMPVYPGDTVSQISYCSDIASAGCYVSQVTTGMHTGTHIDGPLHVIEGGISLSEMPLERFIGRGILIDARNKDRIDADLLEDVRLKRKDIVLVMTGCSAEFRATSYYRDYPAVTVRFAEVLVKAGVNMLGLDMPGPDGPPFAIHRLLLAAQVLIIENLTNLEALLAYPHFEVFALPVRFRTEAAPARVIAVIT
ncbi:MAG: cyclase family protein [Dissulfurispiraceae bacterium]|jgi:kynurenine formamidase